MISERKISVTITGPGIREVCDLPFHGRTDDAKKVSIEEISGSAVKVVVDGEEKEFRKGVGYGTQMGNVSVVINP